ncbi:BppU family phage baseplate upper protein [Eubacterium sp.]|uniref:BppU family phage baseplate upper protein n=1 Tax=Eubacterium sp. TaxID=142586 RepID=UPI0026DF0193|nr:BppU family phage baseplate upper protein [Eubacterium sp.]MDO5431506.1 BppU family phage baseplate upper protein [Eubacterium sp.]
MAITNILAEVALDFQNPTGLVRVVHAKQGDHGTRTIQFTFYNNGQPYTVPSGLTVSYCGTKKDGYGFDIKMILASGNVWNATLTKQVLAVAGRIPVEVKITDGTNILKSMSFMLDIRPAALTDKTFQSSDDYQTFEEYLKEAEQHAKDAEAARAAAVAAQKAAETAKAGAEAAKKDADSAKQQAIIAQRAAETAEDGAEAAQQAAETAKIAAETAKGQAVSAKSDAQASETAAEAAKTAAADSAKAAKSSQDAAASSEQAASQKATEAANSAKAAKASQDSAATSATAATTKAGEAEKHADEAEAAAAKAAQEAAKVKTWKPNVSEVGDLSWAVSPDETPPKTVNITGPPGDKGEQGVPGVVTQLNPGLFGMYVNEHGHLILAHNDNEPAPPIRIENGRLIYTVD